MMFALEKSELLHFSRARAEYTLPLRLKKFCYKAGNGG
jgi:hypothetical protein